MASTSGTLKLAISLIDLTSLTDQETAEDIITLCKQAKSIAGNTAAVCIFPKYITLAKQQLQAQNTPFIKVATVVNFPNGNSAIDNVIHETQTAIALGADEIDLVFPYRALMAGNSDIGYQLVKACKSLCDNNTVLKVIIESGELKDPLLIQQASKIAIAAGADFIKTSTGKVAVNATIEAANIILTTIKNSGENVGFKAAGGVHSMADVKQYLQLITEHCNDAWLTPKLVRFGASKLLDNLLTTLQTEQK